MSEKIFAYALTTLERVKDRAVITENGFDILLSRLINSATDYVESQTGQRFKETTYTNELYSPEANQKYLTLKHAPVSSITSIYYGVGTPSNKNWTAFGADDYELVDDGKSGLVRMHAGLPQGVNTIRATYVAGYKIAFGAAGDAGDASPTHTLPADLTDLCERLIIRWFKRRENAGKSQESFEGSNTTWKDLLDSEDIETINRYKRMPVFV